MAHRVQLTRSAEKEWARLPGAVRSRFVEAIDALAQDPRKARPGVDIKRLRGTKGTWRLRVGEYRGIYELEEGVVVFTRFAHRSKVVEV
jgi:mRNA interferase RelE/StbE